MSFHSEPYVNDDSRRVYLEEYAEKFEGGFLEAHANAFDSHVQQDQPPCQSNYGFVAVTPPDQAPQYQGPYPIPGSSFVLGSNSSLPHHCDYPDPTAINPHAPTHAVHLAVPGSSSHRTPTSSTATVKHHTGFLSPPPSTGFPSPEQPHNASLPCSSAAAANHHHDPNYPPSPSPSPSASSSSKGTYDVCCGKSYGTKFTFDRHRRESRTCPHGSGGRSFVCYLCTNTNQPFGRRASLKQHVQEVHGMSKEGAKKQVDTWYERYGGKRTVQMC